MTKRAKDKFHFRLFVAGESPNSVQAVANLRAMCATYLADRHEIEIVDVMRAPERAMEGNVLLTPTLVKLAPKPIQQVIGNLSDAATLRQALGLEAPG